MSVTRRGLLRAFPALPLIGNEIKQRAAQLADVGIVGPDIGALPSGPYGQGIAAQNSPRGSALVRLIRSLGGFPKWKRNEIRRQAKYLRQLDPDIASLRSVSLVAQMRIQWDRNERRLEQEAYDWHIQAEERQNFLQRTGIDWI